MPNHNLDLLVQAARLLEPLLDELASRLNALAVLAFCAEMTRLPGHWAPRLVPENATAHT